MISKSPFSFVLTSIAVIALTFCLTPDADAQGFRIGNFFQAGGGQGFRLGGPRVGMHFGGGQGASIGAQRLGMRFGNGQGARFGGTNYGMQFGGQQGTQIGQFNTTPSVTPGTYYYGDVQNRGYAQPVVVAQGSPVMIPSTVVSPNDGIAPASFAAPTIAGPAPPQYQPAAEIVATPELAAQPVVGAQPDDVTTAPAETQVLNPTSELPLEGNSVLNSATETETEEPIVPAPKDEN